MARINRLGDKILNCDPLHPAALALARGLNASVLHRVKEAERRRNRSVKDL